MPVSTCQSTYCKGRLVSIHSKNQEQKIIDYIHQTYGETPTPKPYPPIIGRRSVNGVEPNRIGPSHWTFWLGLRQHCLNCPFEWNDLSPVDYTHWNAGEPNNSGDGEDCVQGKSQPRISDIK